MTTATKVKIGWIGAGRMGFEMARQLARAGCDIVVWNRTRAKAEPLAAFGASIADRIEDLADCGIVFTMVSTYDVLKEVLLGADGLYGSGRRGPRILVESSSISVEGSAELRQTLAGIGTRMLAAPVSGNAKVLKAGKLSIVTSGPQGLYAECLPVLEAIAPGRVSYVGEGDLARIAKICHNVFLGVVTQSLAEITWFRVGGPAQVFYLPEDENDLAYFLRNLPADLPVHVVGAGSTPNFWAVSAELMAMSASWFALGVGLTAQSPNTSTRSGKHIKNTLETILAPGLVLIVSKDGRMVCWVVCAEPETMPSARSWYTIIVPK